jgi:hypothetical protein
VTETRKTEREPPPRRPHTSLQLPGMLISTRTRRLKMYCLKYWRQAVLLVAVLLLGPTRQRRRGRNWANTLASVSIDSSVLAEYGITGIGFLYWSVLHRQFRPILSRHIGYALRLYWTSVLCQYSIAEFCFSLVCRLTRTGGADFGPRRRRP